MSCSPESHRVLRRHVLRASLLGGGRAGDHGMMSLDVTTHKNTVGSQMVVIPCPGGRRLHPIQGQLEIVLLFISIDIIIEQE